MVYRTIAIMIAFMSLSGGAALFPVVLLDVHLACLPRGGVAELEPDP